MSLAQKSGLLLSSAAKPQKMLLVNRHLSGGVKITFGTEEIVLSPKTGVDFAVSVLKALEVTVNFDGSMFPQ